VIGLPAALALVEDLGFWKVFFAGLGLETRTSEILKDAVQAGKERMGAEFCAPIAAFHGHALSLLDQADFVFVPIHLEKKGDKGEGNRQFCYATQFSPALVSQLGERKRFLMPLVESDYLSFRVKEELRRCLVEDAGLAITFRAVSEAWDRALAYRSERERRLRGLFAAREIGRKLGPEDIEIVLLGRPYSVLPAGMNKGIPEIIADRGVATWFQDMLEALPDRDSRILPLLHEIPWEYGKRILRAAEVIARTPGLYPTLVTSFKCGPDSFVVDAFKALMDAYGKPFLVLELDEHDSAVGYETRIEAAIRAFRNHRELAAAASSGTPSGAVQTGDGAERSPLAERSSAGDFSAVNPSYATALKGKTLLLPCWDELAAPLLVASLRAAGVDAVLMEETDETIRASLSTNSGQCLPLNAIAESFAHTVRKRGLDPAACTLWMARADFSCNIPLYPHQIKNIFDAKGGGLEKATVYVGELSFIELSPLAAIDAYLSYLFAGLIRRLACRIRPYEELKGMTDAMVARSLDILIPTFEDRRKNKVRAAEEIVALFEAIPWDRKHRKPLVALFGDFYSRDNRVLNQDAIGYIEAQGGEVISMPYNQYAKMIADTYFSRWLKEGRYGTLLSLNALLAASKILEKAYYRLFSRILENPDPGYDDSSAEIMARYGVLVENQGESAENLLKTWYIKKHFPEVSLFVQLSPVFCCAGLVTEAMNRKIEEVTGVPVLSLTYDGTGGSKNDAIAPYLRYPRKARPGAEPAPAETEEERIS
jgi:predicted nucleotide-binding protein (sugar kinase/HSP70/actin superfamily)